MDNKVNNIEQSNLDNKSNQSEETKQIHNAKLQYEYLKSLNEKLIFLCFKKLFVSSLVF